MLFSILFRGRKTTRLRSRLLSVSCLAHIVFIHIWTWWCHLMVSNSNVNGNFSLETKRWMCSGISEGVCADVRSIWDYICKRGVCFFFFFFFTTVHLEHRFAVVHQTAGLIYQRQAACTTFYWFSTNVVTCRDTGLSVCLSDFIWVCYLHVSYNLHWC